MHLINLSTSPPLSPSPSKERGKLFRRGANAPLKLPLDHFAPLGLPLGHFAPLGLPLYAFSLEEKGGLLL